MYDASTNSNDLSNGIENSTKMQINHVLVVEDHDLMRFAMINEVQKAVPDVLIRGVGTKELALQLLREHEFDLILIDPGLPGINPLDPEQRISVVQEIVQLGRTAKHLVVTGFFSPEEQEVCLDLGVSGYISKISLNRDMFSDVLRSLFGERKLGMLEGGQQAFPDYFYSGLTPREQYIIQRMLNRPDKVLKKHVIEQVAARLGIDEDTVSKYYKSGRAKLKRANVMPEKL